jgi:predicted solute-binding protein
MIRLVTSFHLLSAPLIYAFENRLVDYDISIEYMPEAEAFNRLKTARADAGILSPLSYAKNTGEILPVKDFLITSPKGGRNALLYFKGNLKNIDHIYFPFNEFTGDYDRIIAQLILTEFYDIHVKWQDVSDVRPDRTALDKYQVILIPHPQSFDIYPDFPDSIDLSEEWHLRTNLPLVHGLLCVNRSINDPTFLEKLRLSRELGLRNLMKIARMYARNRAQSWDTYFDLLNEKYLFHGTPSGWESLQELLSYFFYHNETEFLTEIKFWDEKK